MEKYCDNRSVGVVLWNERGELALLKRGRFPVGMAPAAGHIDTHGSPEQAGIDELQEELGVSVAIGGLVRTAIHERRAANVCRRMGGDYHVWNIYEAHAASAELSPDPDETKGAAWYDKTAVQALADRTRLYRHGNIDAEDWIVRPGLEEVWVDFLAELGYVQ